MTLYQITRLQEEDDSELRELISRVESLALSPSEPVDIIFAESNDFAAIAKGPMPPTQKIIIAYILFSKQHVYKLVLQKLDEAWSNLHY